MASTSYSSNLSNHSAANYNKHANFVYGAAATSPVLGLLQAKAGERIADFGCGSGELTKQLVDLVGTSGFIFGVDSSQSMLDKAQKDTPTSDNIQWHQADIQNFTLPSELAHLAGTFDCVFSSAVYHWCKANPGGVVEAAKILLKPGGRFVWEMGGFGNCVGVRAGLHAALKKRNIDPEPLDPWYFPTAKTYSSLLEKHGLQVSTIDLVPRPTPLSTTLTGWLVTFARNSFLSTLPQSEADTIFQEVSDILQVDAQDDEGGWHVMYVRLRGVAVWDGQK